MVVPEDNFFPGFIFSTVLFEVVFRKSGNEDGNMAEVAYSSCVIMAYLLSVGLRNKKLTMY